MKANPDEHLILEPKRSRLPALEIVLALAIIAGLVFYWLQSDEKTSGESVVSVPSIVVPATRLDLPATPDIPDQPDSAALLSGPDGTVLASETGVSQLELIDALPGTAMTGDSMLRQELADKGVDSMMHKLMSSEQPINISAAFIDGLGRGLILQKLLPGDPPSQAFSVVQEGDMVYMSPASYQRYDTYTNTLTALESRRLVNSFHALRPMYEQAFQYLGLDPADFDNAIIRTLDQVLATPEIREPIALQPKSVVYIFADPALEGLPAIQKQLLRMGPDNISRIKQQARALREGLLTQ
jgi:hypothetical protein